MSLPKPEPGLVIHYSYLWHLEQKAGSEEGRKNRPAVMLLALKTAAEQTRVVVLPITHHKPLNVDDAVEIPQTIKAHLKLDDARSWIVTTEANSFLWPGHDLHKIPGKQGYAYGFLPPKFFIRVRNAFVNNAKSKKTKMTGRS
jgi:hypothetical protein